MIGKILNVVRTPAFFQLPWLVRRAPREDVGVFLNPVTCQCSMSFHVCLVGVREDEKGVLDLEFWWHIYPFLDRCQHNAIFGRAKVRGDVINMLTCSVC